MLKPNVAAVQDFLLSLNLAVKVLVKVSAIQSGKIRILGASGDINIIKCTHKDIIDWWF